MCNICGKNCGKGGALKKHVKAMVTYEDYKLLFLPEKGLRRLIADVWE